MDKKKIYRTVEEVLNLLVSQSYQEIYDRDLEKRLPPEQIKGAIDEFQGNVSLPSNNILPSIEIYPIDDNKDEVFIDVDLWIDNEPSDLTLQMGIKNINGTYRFSIHDMHVL